MFYIGKKINLAKNYFFLKKCKKKKMRNFLNFEVLFHIYKQINDCQFEFIYKVLLK